MFKQNKDKRIYTPVFIDLNDSYYSTARTFVCNFSIRGKEDLMATTFTKLSNACDRTD